MIAELFDAPPAKAMRMTLTAATLAAGTLGQTRAFAPTFLPMAVPTGTAAASVSFAAVGQEASSVGHRRGRRSSDPAQNATATLADHAPSMPPRAASALSDTAGVTPPPRTASDAAGMVPSSLPAAPVADLQALPTSAPNAVAAPPPTLPLAAFGPGTGRAVAEAGQAPAASFGGFAPVPSGFGAILPAAVAGQPDMPAVAGAARMATSAGMMPPTAALPGAEMPGLPPPAAPLAGLAASTQTGEAAPPGRAMAPPPLAAGQGGPTGGDVILDGVRMGRWVADHLAQEAGRPQRGGTAFDPRIGARWPGTLQGG